MNHVDHDPMFDLVLGTLPEFGREPPVNLGIPGTGGGASQRMTADFVVHSRDEEFW